GSDHSGLSGGHDGLRLRVHSKGGIKGRCASHLHSDAGSLVRRKTGSGNLHRINARLQMDDQEPTAINALSTGAATRSEILGSYAGPRNEGSRLISHTTGGGAVSG